MKKNIVNIVNFILFILIALSSLASLVSAEITLISPQENITTNTGNLTTNILFEYSYNITTTQTNLTNETINETSEIVQCNLTVDNNTWENLGSGSSLGLITGTHKWNVSCANETSETRTINIIEYEFFGDSVVNPVNGTIPLDVNFYASAWGGIPPYSYTWKFGDNATANVPYFIHTYRKNNTYNASITITDSVGQTYEQNFMINAEPVKDFTSSITLDKTDYLIGENAHITIDAPINSSIQLRFYKDSQLKDSIDFVHSEINSDYIYLLYPPYPVSTKGTYELKAFISYKGITKNHTITFQLNELEQTLPLIANIQIGQTSVESDEEVYLKSSVSGGIPPYFYEWDFNSDGTVDSTNTDLIKYFSVGKHNVTLSVVDSNNTLAQKTITITSIEPIYKVIITASDSYTNRLITDADITFAGTTKSTKDSGSTEYNIKGGNYTLKVSKVNYFTYEKKVELKNDLTLSIKLNSTEEKFSVNPLYPLGEIVPETFGIRYSVNGINPECTLFLDDNDGWWASKGKNTGKGEKEFRITLKEGEYQYKIECYDESETIESTVKTFKVKIGAKETQKVQTTDSTENVESTDVSEILGWIETSRDTFQNLDLEEKDVLNSLNFIKLLDEQEKELKSIDKDLSGLKYLTGSPSQIEDRRRELEANLKSIKQKVPENINILDEMEYVKYARADDIRFILTESKKSNDSTSVEQTLGLQKKISILTKVRKVQVDYYYADKKNLIIVEKQLDKKENLENYSFIEYIPKELAVSTKDITFSTPYELVKEDPLVKLDIENVNNLSYYVESNKELELTEKIRSVLMSKDSIKSKRNLITGFSINGIIPIQISDTKLVFEILVIFILLTAVLIYEFGDRIKDIAENVMSSDKKRMYVRKLIGGAMINLEQNDLERAYEKYTELKLVYRALSKKDKQIVLEDITSLASNINSRHLRHIIDEGIELMQAGNKDDAIKIYSNVEQIYSGLNKNHKNELYDKTIQFHRMLTD